MDELPPKFLVVHTRQDRPMTDDEPRMVEGHGFTPEEFTEMLAKYNHFEIAGQRYEIVRRTPERCAFTMKLVK